MHEHFSATLLSFWRRRELCGEGDLGGLQGDSGAGYDGYINEYWASRLLRDAKLYKIGGGTSEIQRMLIGRELFCEAIGGRNV